MREHSGAGRWLAFVISHAFPAIVIGGCGGGDIGSGSNGTTSDALGGCVIGADCNVRGQVCNVDPKDSASPRLFCLIPDGAISGTFQKSCQEGGLCTPGETCKRTFTTPDSGPDEWFVCNTSAKLVPMTVPDTFIADTLVADTGTADTLVADTAVADTATADTSVADTVVADTVVADTVVADTVVADTAVADTATADTSVADSAADSVTDSTTDSVIADSASDAPADSGDAGLSCVPPTTAMDCIANAYGCKNPDIGAWCTATTGAPPEVLFCKCGDGAGLGWLLPWGTACSSVPVCVPLCDGGTCPETGVDATVDTTVTDTTVTDSTDGGGTPDTAASDSDASDTTVVTDVPADTVTDASDAADVAESSGDSSGDVADATDTGPCIPADSGVDASSSMTVFRWVPPAGYVQTGAVNLVGSTSDGSVSDWSTTPGTGLIALAPDGCGAYVGSISFPAGVTFIGNVKHADSSLSPSGVGWVFDTSSKAGGGCSILGRSACCGQNFGTFTVTKGGAAVPFVRVSNCTTGSGTDAACPVTSPDLSCPVGDGGTTNGQVYFNIRLST